MNEPMIGVLHSGYVRIPYESLKVEWSNGTIHYLPIHVTSPAKLRSGNECTQMEYDQFDALHAELAAWQGALRRLERSACTSKELKLFLIKKGFKKELIQQTIDRASAQGMIDDQAMANRLAEQKFHRQGKGRLRVQMELQQKGISSAQIREATESLSESDESSMALAWAAKKWPSVKGEGRDKAMRMARQLHGRGYSSSIVRYVLEQLRVNLDNLENESLQ